MRRAAPLFETLFYDGRVRPSEGVPRQEEAEGEEDHAEAYLVKLSCQRRVKPMTTRHPPKLLTISEAATLLKVSEATIEGWTLAERVPYMELPDGSQRLPQSALLAALPANYDLATELRELDERNAGLTDEQVQAALNEG